jgi:hypothetical protein
MIKSPFVARSVLQLGGLPPERPDTRFGQGAHSPNPDKPLLRLMSRAGFGGLKAKRGTITGA